MKIRIYKWFTLIELLVVITILTTISVSWFWYFNWFLDKQELNWDLTLITSKINNLDYRVKSKEIFDYRLMFETNNSWSLMYKYYENYYDTIYNQDLKLNLFTWSWTITSNNWGWNDENVWQIKIYAKSKLLKEDFLSWTWIYNHNFDLYSSYKISWYLTWQILNDIYVDYFSEKNLDKINPSFLILSSINSEEDKSWNSYTWIIIENINNKKRILNLGDLNEINTDLYLFFENNIVESFIKIKN